MPRHDILGRAGGAAAAICARGLGYIKLARVAPVDIDGRAWVRKQRLGAAPLLVRIGRFYARALTVPVEFLDLDAWQRWEHVMHAAAGLAIRVEPRGICMLLRPGRPLLALLADPGCAAAVRRRAVRAALRALRALHERPVRIDGRLVQPSHGDASAGNVLYDERTDRAGWIDFELRHPFEIDASLRRADDLRTFLFSVASRLPLAQLPGLIDDLQRDYPDRRLHGALRRLLARDARRWLFGIVQSPIDPGRRRRLTAALHAALLPAGGAR